MCVRTLALPFYVSSLKGVFYGFFFVALCCFKSHIRAVVIEGYDMSRIEGVVAYTLERTAGTGVAYVRAKMMPEKQLVIAPAETRAEAPVAAEPPEEKIKDMEPMFHDKQKK